MPVTTEPHNLVTSRAPFFKAVDITTQPIFCGDERPGNITSPYIHLMGGGLNPVYTNMVVRELNQPGSVTKSFAAETATVITALLASGLHPGVHSDAASEPTGEYDHTSMQAVGCGFAKLRQAVSAHIATEAVLILERLIELYPELASTSDKAIAEAVIAAHDRLQARSELFSTGGRAVTNAAVAAGAETMLVYGEHTGRVGIINEVADTTLDNIAANLADRAAYNHDIWASKVIQSRLREQTGFDERQLLVAELIDVIGTMNALGVSLEQIVVRRSTTMA